MRHTGRRSPKYRLALSACLLLVACSAGRQSVPRQYEQARDSATQAAVTRPALSTPQLGEKMAVVPPVRPSPIRPPMVGALAAGAAAGGLAVIAASESLDPELLERIDEALAACADAARSEVMDKHFGSRGPTHEECNEEVGRDNRGEPITRAMQLGEEQHRVALTCAEQRLSELKPGGFSISPRYRYDPATGKAVYIPREVVRQLLSQGRGAELRGTLEPDIVIHEGKPHQIQAVRDFKFPCVNTGNRSEWRLYRQGQAHAGNNQGELYEKALKVRPGRVQPHLGVY